MLIMKIIDKLKKKKPEINFNDNIVEFPKKFIPLLLDHEQLSMQTIHLTEYFRSSENLVIDLEEEKPVKPDLKVITLEKSVDDKEERYNKFFEYVKLHSDTDGKILVTNNDIIVNLDLSKKIVENLKIEGCNKGDLYVKNQKTYIELDRIGT